jgi:hypothetical protein
MRDDEPYRAGVAQLVECQPSKLDVAGSNPVARSRRWTASKPGFCAGKVVNVGPRSSVGRARPW